MIVWTLVYSNCDRESLESLKEGVCYAVCKQLSVTLFWYSLFIVFCEGSHFANNLCDCDGQKTVNCSRMMTIRTIFDFYGLFVFCGGRGRKNRKLSLCVCNVVVFEGTE